MPGMHGNSRFRLCEDSTWLAFIYFSSSLPLLSLPGHGLGWPNPSYYVKRMLMGTARPPWPLYCCSLCVPDQEAHVVSLLLVASTFASCRPRTYAS